MRDDTSPLNLKTAAAVEKTHQQHPFGRQQLHGWYTAHFVYHTLVITARCTSWTLASTRAGGHSQQTPSLVGEFVAEQIEENRRRKRRFYKEQKERDRRDK